MKKVLFITSYDMICYGVRILSAIVKECGLESHVVLFKGEKSYVPIWRNKDKYKTYQYYYNGLLRGNFFAIDHYTHEDVEILLNNINSISPNVICLSTRSFAYPIFKDIVPKIKKHFPNIPIVGGGWGPSLEPEKFLEFCDYVCFGEGETAIKAICANLENNKDLNDVPNLVYFKNNILLRNTVATPLTEKEMNLLPFPDYTTDNKYLIDKNKLHLGKDFYNEKVYDCFAGRGCPLNCSYCMSGKYRQIYLEQAELQAQKYRLRDLDIVFKEVLQAKERGATFIRFKDEVFPIKPQWVKGFLARYKTEIGLPFFAFIRPEYHTVETIKALRDSGLCVTMVGIQSGSEYILNNIYKRTTLSKEKIVDFARIIAELGIQYSYHFIYRNPFETKSHLKESLEFTYQLPFANVFIYKLQPFPGSPLSKMIDELKPIPLSKRICKWYAMLHSLSLKSPFHRKMAKIIHKYNLFLLVPDVLILLFVPSLLKEYLSVLKNKKYYKAALHFSPQVK